MGLNEEAILGADTPAQRLAALARQITRFGLVGLAATATHVLAFAVLMESFAGLQGSVANLMAFGLAVVVSYFGHARYTFPAQGGPDASGTPRGRGPYRCFARFTITAVIGLILNSAIVYAIVDHLGYPYAWAVPPMIAVVPAITFLIAKFWTFREGGEPAPSRAGSTTVAPSGARKLYVPFLTFGYFCVIAGAALWFFIVFGPPVGHSFPLNYHWSQAFQAQLLAGELYPRWLFAVNENAGSPAFYFYGPLPFWINAAAAALLCPGCSAERAMMVGPSLLLALSGVSFYGWARSQVRPLAALLAATCYMVLPYHFLIDLWHRQTLGEFAVYAWLPLILLGLEKASRSAIYLLLAAAAYAALITSHLPSALIFSPLIVLFVLLRHRPAQWLPFIVVPVVLGLGIAAIYLVPALTTQDYIDAAAWWTALDGFYDPVNWLWFDGREAPAAGFAKNVLLALVAPSALSLVVVAGIFYFQPSGKKQLTIFAVLALGCAWFLMSSPSAILWSQITILAKIQFPWRLGIVVDLSAATLLAVWLDWVCSQHRLVKSTLFVVLIAMAGPYLANAPLLYRLLWETKGETEMAALRQSLAHSEDAPEYRTVWSIRSSDGPPHHDLSEALAQIPHARIVWGQGAVSDLRQELLRLSLTVEATTPVLVRFRRFYYPGWQLTSAGDSRSIAIRASSDLGLLEAELPAGRHRLVLERQAIEEESVGMIVSVASLAAGLALLAVILVQGRRTQVAQA